MATHKKKKLVQLQSELTTTSESWQMSSRAKTYAAESRQEESHPGKNRSIYTCISSWLFSISLFLVHLINLEKKINTHIQWHFCQGVSNTIFEQGSRKMQLHRDLLIQLSQASNSLKIRKPRSPLSTTDGHQIFHKQLKKPGRQAKALFKNPAGTTHRHPAANTSFNRNNPKYTAHWANTSHTPAEHAEEKVSPPRTKLFACCLQRRTPCAWGLLTLIPQLQAATASGGEALRALKGSTTLEEAKYILSQRKLRPQSTFAIYLLI